MNGSDSIVMLVVFKLIDVSRGANIGHGGEGLARGRDILARIITDIARLDSGTIGSWELRTASVAYQPRGGNSLLIRLWSEIHNAGLLVAMKLRHLGKHLAGFGKLSWFMLFIGRAGLENRLCAAF